MPDDLTDERIAKLRRGDVTVGDLDLLCDAAAERNRLRERQAERVRAILRLPSVERERDEARQWARSWRGHVEHVNPYSPAGRAFAALPWTQEAFGTHALGPQEAFVAGALALVPFIAVEGAKAVMGRTRRVTARFADQSSHPVTPPRALTPR